MSAIQLQLRLKHTEATEAGEASVWQCRHCGACICHQEADKPAGRCPSCAEAAWARQTLPVSVFRPLVEEDC
jgi:rubrerythrin